MTKIAEELILSFFIALGVVLGGSIVGALGASLLDRYPMETMANLARQIKVWAVLVAIGGTFPSLYVLEAGLFEGQLRAVARQILFILVAFSGAQLGYMLILLLKGD